MPSLECESSVAGLADNGFCMADWTLEFGLTPRIEVLRAKLEVTALVQNVK